MWKIHAEDFEWHEDYEEIGFELLFKLTDLINRLHVRTLLLINIHSLSYNKEKDELVILTEDPVTEKNQVDIIITKDFYECTLWFADGRAESKFREADLAADYIDGAIRGIF